MKPITSRKKRYVLKHCNDEDKSKRQLAREMKISKSSAYRIIRNLGGCKPYALPPPKQCGRKNTFSHLKKCKKLSITGRNTRPAATRCRGF